jgi:hypothetical protein
MIITNDSNLPQPIVDAVTKDPYSSEGSDISVTRLIQPPRKVALEKAHKAEIVEDAADRLWALMGQIGHGILQRSATAGLIEKRFFSDIAGWKVSGACDILQKTGTILDYKFTSVWAAKDGLKPEWEQQLNLLTMLARNSGEVINDAQIVCIFRDWSVMEARRNADYPQKQVKVFNVPLWANETTRSFAHERVLFHQVAQNVNLPQCTPEERWEKPTVYAVMKKGRVRAVRLYDNQTDAEKHVASEKNTSVVVRPGESTRCLNYCSAAPFCEQFKATQQEQEEPEALDIIP